MSWGIDCASPSHPGVYAEIPAAISWINGIVDTDPGGGPTIDSASPTAGPADGGMRLRINGSGFADATSVTVGGVEAPTWRVRGDSRMVVVTPAGSPGATEIVITTPGGSASTGFTYEGSSPAEGPEITSATRRSGPARGGTRITLRGSGLGEATSVTVGGVEARRWSTRGDSRINLVTPTGTPGPTTIEVVTPGGTDTVAFTYT